MGTSSRDWFDPSDLRPDRADPYLRIQCVVVMVRDQDQALQFYLDQLGFQLIVDDHSESGDRWITVAPPDGTALLAIVAPRPGSEASKLVGRATQVVFVTDDVAAKYGEWLRQGVRFHSPPQLQPWGGTVAVFEDPDGNIFSLISFDQLSREIEARRRAAAEKLEAERRVVQELEIAKQVQARLFPQILPPMRTLDYAGLCIQAREVGGDYYDFLDLGHQRLGLVLGDISGKGIAAALLMANLQANLRSQCAVAHDEPVRFLRSVNQLFYESTDDHAYATLFFAEYDDATGRLRYASCGHLSALLLRRDGTLERLDSTATVLGLFKEWDCSLEERLLLPGDILALYTDGVTESFNAVGDEFGEGRLVEALRRHRALPPSALLGAIVDEVRQFSPHEQHDDITLILAARRS